MTETLVPPGSHAQARIQAGVAQDLFLERVHRPQHLVVIYLDSQTKALPERSASLIGPLFEYPSAVVLLGQDLNRRQTFVGTVESAPPIRAADEVYLVQPEVRIEMCRLGRR